MYKDKDKQREANRLAQAKFKAKGITKGITQQGITDGVLPDVIPKPEHYQHQAHCSAPSHIKPFTKGVSCSCRKRGKDIKVFADLPPDIQQTIDTLSDDKTEHKRRTAIAINYQHQFPDRYHSTGCDVFKRRARGLTGYV